MDSGDLAHRGSALSFFNQRSDMREHGGLDDAFVLQLDLCRTADGRHLRGGLCRWRNGAVTHVPDHRRVVACYRRLRPYVWRYPSLCVCRPIGRSRREDAVVELARANQSCTARLATLPTTPSGRRMSPQAPRSTVPTARRAGPVSSAASASSTASGPPPPPAVALVRLPPPHPPPPTSSSYPRPAC